jgi:TPR repeat protein
MVLARVILREPSAPEAGGFFAQAAPRLRVRAGRGDADACFSLGYLHRKGLGMAQDSVEGLAWMLRAQRLGISPMQVFALQSFEKSLSPD